jgi:hypothetical protein
MMMMMIIIIIIIIIIILSRIITVAIYFQQNKAFSHLHYEYKDSVKLFNVYQNNYFTFEY